jgi:hypothetical protein
MTCQDILRANKGNPAGSLFSCFLLLSHTFSIEQIFSGLTDFLFCKANIMLVQAKAFYLFLLLMSSHGEVILGSSVDAEGPDLDGASTLYSRPGPPNLFGEDNKEVRN